MNWIAIADVISTLAFASALLFVAAIPYKTPKIGKLFKYTLLAAISLYVFVGVSNVLEHAGITAFLDTYEDFAEVLYVPLVAYVLYSRAAAERLVEAQRDEAAIRREHELLMGVVETTPAGILIADEEGGVIFENELAREILGIARPRQLDIARIVRDAPSALPREPIGDGDGRLFVSVRCRPLAPDEHGRRRAVVVLVDVTQRVRNEEELERYGKRLERDIDLRTAELLEANRQLQEAITTREDFFARMSHELRTPLNSIVGFTDVILKGLSGPLTDDQQLQLGMVKSSSRDLLEIVNDLLDIVRVEAGHTSVTLRAVDLTARMRGIAASLGAVAELHGVALTFDGPDGVMVSTDPDKLDQIARNLLSNGLKFTEKGGRVAVTVGESDGFGVVTVADTGIGIAPEDQERVFEAFEQVEAADRSQRYGTGLGLAISRELCDLLGCELAVTSALGEGSTFTLRVPREFAGASGPS